jgi:hypothetical protein
MIDSLMVVGWGQLNCSPELIRSKHGVKHDERSSLLINVIKAGAQKPRLEACLAQISRVDSVRQELEIVIAVGPEMVDALANQTKHVVDGLLV